MARRVRRDPAPGQEALSPKTMDVRDVPGLYFMGEVMDVTGWLGGYNFQGAWASAAAMCSCCERPNADDP